MFALEGEVISSALFANGIRIFGHHPVENAPQGVFCVNGQCSQCMVLVEGVPVKGCMTPVREQMRVTSCEGIPPLPPDDSRPDFASPRVIETEVLVIGGGPAGLNAAIELGKLEIDTLVVDDKNELGGKLTLQTHPFFGSREDCYAGVRGIDIAGILTGEMDKLEPVRAITSTTAVGAFSDGMVGLYGNGEYTLVRPKAVIVACGAREKSLAFPGCDLPGVYGAGAFQTLLNRDLIRPTERLFIVGGGNVGLITGYHAIQAGIKVVGLVEALPECGGYKVHSDKLKRLGVPVLTSHTVVRAEGEEQLERITIAEVDESFRPRPGTEKSYQVDTLLVAVGLSPVNELHDKLKEFGVRSFTCGDSAEISEASAAIFSGKITGRKVAEYLGREVEIPASWDRTEEVLRSKPGRVTEFEAEEEGLEQYPLIRCVQEIPCNPCVDACPKGSILIPGENIMGLPRFEGDCVGCLKCVAACPALAITLVQPSERRGRSKVVIPFELDARHLSEGAKVQTTGMDGEVLGEGEIFEFRRAPMDKKRHLVTLEVASGDADKVTAFRVLEPEGGAAAAVYEQHLEDDTIVCRCERVTAGAIKKEILNGVRDMNILKATLRAGMGACGGKTCTDLILRLFIECGVDPSEVTPPTERPFVAEVPMSCFAGIKKGDKGDGK